MEKAQRVRLSDGTEIVADPMVSYGRFLKITTGPVTVRLSHTDAAALFSVLTDYFTQPEVLEALGA